MSDSPATGPDDGARGTPAARDPRRASTRHGRVARVLGAVAIVVALGFMLWVGMCSCESLYVCAETGALRRVSGACIPGTNVELMRSTAIEETPVSRHIRAALGDKTPAHDWVFIHSRSFWIDATGGGAQQLMNAQTEELGRFLHALYDAGEYAEFDDWRHRSLAKGTRCRLAAYLMGVGRESCKWQDKDAFRKWWEAERDNLRSYAEDRERTLCSRMSWSRG